MSAGFFGGKKFSSSDCFLLLSASVMKNDPLNNNCQATQQLPEKSVEENNYDFMALL